MPVTRSGQDTAGPSSDAKISSRNLAIRDGRSRAKRTRPSPQLTDLSSEVEESDNIQPDEIERSLRHALCGVSALRAQVSELEAKNKLLREQLDVLKEAEEEKTQPRRGRKGGMSVHTMLMKVRKLSNEIMKLEKSREKDRRKIRKLQKREIIRDAADLQEGASQSIEDKTDKMRQLLRKFYSIITSPSLEEDEECIVCFKKLNTATALSLPCQHVFCQGCLELNAQAQMGSPKCPTCRKVYEPDLDGTERVQRTATQQWDELLEVAQGWAKIDNHGGEDEPEDTEEEEAPFIQQDEDQETRSNLTLSESAGSEIEEDHDVSKRLRTRLRRLETPPSSANAEPGLEQEIQLEGDGNIGVDVVIPEDIDRSVVSYQQSPTSEKRKRMEELVASRRLKRRL